MEKKQVFISYKSEEFDEALWVKNTLEQQGITCWMAPMSITGGASYAAEIPAAINNCRVFVLILSEKVQKSKWVPRELDQAINANKVIMPFMLEDCQLKDEFKFYLSNIQRYFAYQDKLATMDIMSREIRSILGIPDPPVEKPAEPVPVTQTPAEPVKSNPPKKERVPGKIKAPGKKRRILPIILGAVAASIVLPVLLIVMLISGQKTTFANTEVNMDAYSLEIKNQTVTAADMKMLTDFKNLHRICLTNCTIETTDLSAFSIQQLYELTLEGCNLTDGQLQSIDFAAMTNLNTLNVSGNTALSDLNAVIPTADHLTSLSIGNTGIQDPEILKHFTKLTHLALENLGLKTLEPLSMAVYLETLIADGNQLTNLNGLENTTILETVSLKDNKLQKVDPLANSAATLKELYLDGNLLNDLTCLSPCTGVTAFSANHNRLTSIYWAHDWTALHRLSVSDNWIKGAMSMPPQSPELRFLDLSGNALTSIDGFVWSSEYYITVNLSDNDLTSVTLPNQCKYAALLLHGNPLTDLSCADRAMGSTLSIDYFDGMDAQKLNDLAFSKICIIDCPPNRIVELEQAADNVTLLNRQDIPTQLPDPEFPEY